MASIPLPAPAKVSQLSVEAGAPASSRTGEEYGAPAAEALAQVGGALQGLGSSIASYAAKQQGKKDQEAVATGLLNASYQERNNNNVINYPDRSGAGLPEATHEDYMKFVDEKVKDFAKTGASASAQRDFRLQLLERGRAYVDQSAVTASKMAEDNAATELDRGTATLLNDIGANGLTSKEQHITAVTAGEKAIDAQVGLTANQKQARKLDLRNKAGIVHFDTLMHAAKTPEEVQTLITDLHTEFWRKQLDTPDYMKVEGALAATASAMGEISSSSAASTHVNKVRLDPTKYDDEMAAMEKEIRSTPGIDPVTANKEVADKKSDLTRMYFETIAEKATTYGEEGLKTGKLKTTEEAMKGINEIIDELHKDPKWGATMTDAQMNNLLNNLEVRKNNIEQVFNKVQSDLVARQNAVVSELKSQLGSDMASINERLTANQPVPDSELQGVVNTGAVLIKMKGMTPELSKLYAEISAKAKVKGVIDTSGKTLKDLDEIQRQIINSGNHEFKLSPDGKTLVHTPTGRHSPGRTKAVAADATGGTGDYNDPTVGRRAYTKGSGAKLIAGDSGHVPVTANIHDATSVRGMAGAAYTILEAGSANAASHGVVRLEVVAGRGPGHKSHAGGYDWDIVGYQANGQVWTDDQRAQVARDMMTKGGADRIGLYEGGTHRNLLHIGKSHPGFGPAMWGAGGGLTSGAASRQYSGAESRKLLAEFSGGHATGGAPGSHGAGGGSGTTFAKRNNPGNLRVTDFTRSQAGFVREEGGFAVFDTVEHGFQAMNSLLDSYAKGGNNTISSIITKWAPPSENDTASYIATVAKKLGIDPNKDLTPEDRQNLVRAMTEVEQGHSVDGSIDVSSGGAVARSPTDLLTVPEAGFTQSQHNQLEVVAKAREQMLQGLNTDLITTGAKLLGVPVQPLSDMDGFKARSDLYNKLVTVHNATTEQQKPFTVEEAAALSKLFNSVGNNEQKAQVYAGITTWAPEMQKAAFKQVEQSSPFGAVVGRLYGDGKKDTALQAQRGDDMLKTAKANDYKIKWADAMQTANTDVLGNVLRGTPDAGLTALGIGKAELYRAIYADKYGLDGEFNQAAYEQIVEQVEGGQFGTINGTRVLKPVGVEDGEWEVAQKQLLSTPEVSTTHLTPMAIDMRTGQPGPAIPSALDDAHPIRVGPDTYQFLDNAGQYFVVKTDKGIQKYEAVLDAKTVKEAAARITASPIIPEATVQPTPLYNTSGGGGGPGALPSPTLPADTVPTKPEPPAPPAPPVKPIPLSKDSEARLQSYVEKYEAALRRSGTGEDTIKQLSGDFAKMLRERIIRTGH